jgi:tight adherence protein B
MGFYVLTALGIWAASVAIWMVVSRAFRSADVDKVKSRLLGTSSSRPGRGRRKSKKEVSLLQVEDKITGKIVLRLLGKLQLNERVRTLLEQAGIKWKVARFMHACLGLFLLGFVAAWYTVPSAYRSVALLVGAVLGVTPLLYVLRKRTKRLRAFEEQFPESLEFVARSMRAGHGFAVSLEMIHKEFQEPLASEFRRAFEEHNLGLPLDMALQKLAQRIPLLDVHFFVSAVLLQKRTGGNLAEILDKLAYVIRERFKLRGRIRAISAHGRMTGAALSIIPLAVAALMFVVNPPYVQFFINDDTGQVMAGVALALQLLGFLIIKKIVSIEV